MGGVCARCGGGGGGGEYRHEAGVCPGCRVVGGGASGRTPGHGPKVMASHPLTKVVVTDQSADVQWAGRAETLIWRRHLNDFDDRMPGFLPPSVWESNHISEAIGPTGARVPKRFSSQEDAQAALSDALIAWAKSQKV